MFQNDQTWHKGKAVELENRTTRVAYEKKGIPLTKLTLVRISLLFISERSESIPYSSGSDPLLGSIPSRVNA